MFAYHSPRGKIPDCNRAASSVQTHDCTWECLVSEVLQGQKPMSRKVRAVVHTPHGCSERTTWFPEGSPEATAAMEELVKRQTTIYAASWEYWDDREDNPLDSGEKEE